MCPPSAAFAPLSIRERDLSTTRGGENRPPKKHRPNVMGFTTARETTTCWGEASTNGEMAGGTPGTLSTEGASSEEW